MWGRFDRQPAVLLLAGPEAALQLCQQLARVPLAGLTVTHTVSEAEAHLRLRAWDVLLLDGPLLTQAWPLLQTSSGGLPMVLLLDDRCPEAPPAALLSAPLWLPRSLAFEHASLLQAALDQAGTLADLEQQLARTQGHLRESQTQMETMLRLLGTTGSSPGSPRWHSHRAMLERLTEEVARVERHGGTLSVVLAEVAQPGAEPGLLVWVAEYLSQRKRGCDVIGQYGPQGFMMVLPQTETPGARECCTRLAALLSAHGPLTRTGTGWRLDYGVASYLQPHTSAKSILRLAEEELDRSRLASR
jgi:hypothetical protein